MNTSEIKEIKVQKKSSFKKRKNAEYAKAYNLKKQEINDTRKYVRGPYNSKYKRIEEQTV